MARLTFRQLAGLVAQLMFVVALLYRFRIEEQFGLHRILGLLAGGFVLHALLPRQYRRWFFVLISLVAIGVVLPWPHSVGLVALALGLIAIVHLPVQFGVRVVLVMLVALGLAGVRLGWLPSLGWDSLPTQVLPLLGAMFMFRLVVYIYDVRHEKTAASLSERLGYFFLLPNPCFPLFQVVDFNTYRRTYYNVEEYAVYQKGILWMLRGITHLLLYRLIYQYFVPTSSEIQNLAGVVAFAFTAYLLYLRVSGLFHLIVGMLCLFGFNLPETHRRYFLASSFNDFWRRINIYWKDFMMKMLYYPTVTGLKGLGVRGRLAIATMVVFVGTWALHSYQYLWLQGTFPLTVPDLVFWGLLGGLVIVNSLREASKQRTRKLRQATWEWQVAAKKSLQTVGIFTFMCILWSFWGTPSVGEWLAVVSQARHGLTDAWWILAILVAAVGTGVFGQWLSAHRSAAAVATQSPGIRDAAYVVSVSAVLLAMTMPQVTGRIGGWAVEASLSLREERANERDRELVDRGYYEGLLLGGQLSLATRLDGGRPPGTEWSPIRDAEFVEQQPDLFEYVMQPSFTGVWKGAQFSTNSWGLRGREYALSKPPGTFRVAVLGASYELGGGVPDSQTYANQLERRLNEKPPHPHYPSYEVVNFAVGGYSMLQKLLVAERWVPAFSPDLLVLTVYSTEEIRQLSHLARGVAAGLPIPYPEVSDIVARSGATSRMSESAIRNRLRPFVYDVISWSLAAFAAHAHGDQGELLTVFLPRTIEEDDGVDAERWTRLWELAVEAGLEPVSLRAAFAGYESDDLSLANWDDHPNARGHALLAQSLYDVLRTRLSMSSDVAPADSPTRSDR